MASEKMKDKGYVKWVMKQENATGPVLESRKYIIAHRNAETPTTPPAAAPPSPAPPATPHVYHALLLAASASHGAASSSHGADMSLHRNLDLMESKMNSLTELVRRLMAREPLEVTPEVPPEVPPKVPEPFALATLA